MKQPQESKKRNRGKHLWIWICWDSDMGQKKTPSISVFLGIMETVMESQFTKDIRG